MIKLCEPDISENDIRLVNEVLKSGWLAHGPFNKKFEEAFADYIGVKYAVTLNSCTSALELAILSQEIKGEVLLPSFTWNASANSIVTSGAKPVFIDIDYDTCNIDIEKLESSISERTEAIMPVHYGGQSCNMQRIMEIAEKNNLKVIEDSAETLGGTWMGRKTGSFGVGCFSFFPTKNLVTGEGGMLTTNDKALADKVKALSAHGVTSHTIDRQNRNMAWYRESSYPGYNYRMSNILAALGFSQLSRIEEMNANRIKVANLYNKRFSEISGIIIPSVMTESKHVFQMYTLKFPELNRKLRDELVSQIREAGVEVSVHFTPPVHKQPAYFDEFGEIDLPITNLVSDTIMTLPMYPKLDFETVNTIADIVIDQYEKLK